MSRKLCVLLAVFALGSLGASAHARGYKAEDARQNKSRERQYRYALHVRGIEDSDMVLYGKAVGGPGSRKVGNVAIRHARQLIAKAGSGEKARVIANEEVALAKLGYEKEKARLDAAGAGESSRRIWLGIAASRIRSAEINAMIVAKITGQPDAELLAKYTAAR